MSPPISTDTFSTALSGAYSLSGVRTLLSIELALNTPELEDQPEALASRLAPHRALLEEIKTAGLHTPSMERLLRVVDGRDFISPADRHAISGLIRGTLTFLGVPPPVIDQARASRDVHRLPVVSNPAPTPETDIRSFLDIVLNSLTHPFYVIRVADHRVVMANNASGIDIHALDATCHTQTHQSPIPCQGVHICPLDEVVRTKQPVIVEHHHFDSHGRDRIVEIHAYPLFDESGEVALMIEYALDITDKRTALKALQESESRFREIFHHAPMAIATVAPGHKILDANQSMVNYFGYTREELLGKTVAQLTHPDDLQPNIALQEQLFRGEISDYKMEKRYVRKDGSLFWGHLTVSLLRDDNGRPLHMIGMMEDITAHRALHEAEIRRAKAEENSQTLQFIGRGLAHDLNNALMSFMNLSSYIQMGVAPDTEILGDIEKANHRMARLIRNLHELGKPQSKGWPFDINMELGPADLGGLLEDRRGLYLRLDPEPWPVPGPQEQIARVFQNLVTNARDAMRKSPLKRLTITSEKVSLKLDQIVEDKKLYGWGAKPGDYMRIRFADSGPGIEDALIDRIFVAGFSTKKKAEVGDDPNHGLGLAIVRKIINDAGGFVTVQNATTGGAQFDIYLPRVE